MLRTRILGAFVLIPLAIGVLALGGWWYTLVIAAVLAVAAWEFHRLMQQGNQTTWLPAAVALAWIPLADFVLPEWELLTPGLALLLLASLVWAMTRFNQGDPNPAAAWALTVMGGLYLGLFGHFFVRLRALDEGFSWSLVAFGGTWLADSGAYFVGRAWGRRKLAPKLSPGKTWEGVIGGLVIGTLFASLLATLLGRGAEHGLVLGVLIATITPLGDLGISMFKRQVGAKDSSKLIPGHGGILDKIDTLLISVAIAYYYLAWVVK